MSSRPILSLKAAKNDDSTGKLIVISSRMKSLHQQETGTPGVTATGLAGDRRLTNHVPSRSIDHDVGPTTQFQRLRVR